MTASTEGSCGPMSWRLGKLAAALAVAMSLIPQPAAAVVNGTPDESAAYPYVGTLVIQVPQESGPARYHYWCSGTMISPRVFLAAGHCFDQGAMDWYFPGATLVGLTLNANLAQNADADGYMAALPDPIYSGTGSQAPGWPGKGWSLDVGAFTLDGDGVAGLGELPALPAVGQLDTMRLVGRDATIVGYGLDRTAHQGRNAAFGQDGIRAYGTERITGVEPGRLHLLGNIASGGSGPCAGDSGAPRLIDVDGAPLLAAISSGIGPNCGTPEVARRLDTPDISAYIQGLLGGE